MTDPEIIPQLLEEDITMLDAPEMFNEEEVEQLIDDENILPLDEDDEINNNTEQISPKRLKLDDKPIKKSSAKKSKQKTSKWILYLSENRKRVIDENPELNFPQVTKFLAEQYKSLSTEEIESLDKRVAEINTNLASVEEQEGENEENIETVKSPAELSIPLVSFLHFPLTSFFLMLIYRLLGQS